MWHVGISGLHPPQKSLCPTGVDRRISQAEIMINILICLDGSLFQDPAPSPSAVTYPPSTHSLLWQETYSVTGCCARNPLLWGYLSLSQS